MTGAEVSLIRPGLAHLSAYVDALERGWFPDNVRGPPAAAAQLDRIARDAPGFLDSLDDPEGRGAPHELPDGTLVQLFSTLKNFRCFAGVNPSCRARTAPPFSRGGRDGKGTILPRSSAPSSPSSPCRNRLPSFRFTSVSRQG